MSKNQLIDRKNIKKIKMTQLLSYYKVIKVLTQKLLKTQIFKMMKNQ